ncbi:hypothetical protein BpHYR1_052580, partial [Brachionus plicatilis]
VLNLTSYKIRGDNVHLAKKNDSHMGSIIVQTYLYRVRDTITSIHSLSEGRYVYYIPSFDYAAPQVKTRLRTMHHAPCTMHQSTSRPCYNIVNFERML